jgi:uncharacterized Zn finger protein
MKCPNCGERRNVEIDMHSQGFTAPESPVKECGACGLVWRIKPSGENNVLDIISSPAKTAA